MAVSAPLDDIVANVRAAAEACGALIIDATLALEPGTVPVAQVDAETFCKIIRVIRPRLVYVWSSPLVTTEDVLVALEEADQRLLVRPRFEKFVAKWQHRDGQTARIALGLMCDGVLHGLIEDAEWFEEFEAEAETLAEDVDHAKNEHERRVQASERERLVPYVTRLISDSRFTAPKVGVAKRTTLARALFPEVDDETISTIVAQAEQRHWLDSADR